jgi:hypothetical protein
VIEYSKTERGDILRMVKSVPGLRGFARGDLVRVTARTEQGVMTENRHGEPCEFVFNCGAAHLEPTEWKDFPEQAAAIKQSARHCCFIPCEAPAEWQLTEGPTPDDFTDACTAHVGALLTGKPTTVTAIAKGE